MYYHGLICFKSSCKINHFVNIVSNTLLNQLPPKEKVQNFQKYCGICYDDFIKLYLKKTKKLADLEIKKEEIKEMASIKEMTKKEFEKKITEFKECKDLHCFLINLLNLILTQEYFYCFWEKFKGLNLEFGGPKKYTLCRIPIIFNDIEKKLDYNTNNYEFLKCYHAKLLPYLVEIFDVIKESIDCFFGRWFCLFGAILASVIWTEVKNGW